MEPKRVSTCEWYWWCLEARSWFWFSLMVMIWRLLPLRSGPSLCWDILELCVTTAIIVFLRIYHVFLCIHKYSYFTIHLSVKKTLPVGKLLEAGRSSRQRRVNLCGQFFTIGGAADLSTSVKRLTERERNAIWVDIIIPTQKIINSGYLLLNVVKAEEKVEGGAEEEDEQADQSREQQGGSRLAAQPSLIWCK